MLRGVIFGGTDIPVGGTVAPTFLSVERWHRHSRRWNGGTNIPVGGCAAEWRCTHLPKPHILSPVSGLLLPLCLSYLVVQTFLSVVFVSMSSEQVMSRFGRGKPLHSPAHPQTRMSVPPMQRQKTKIK